MIENERLSAPQNKALAALLSEPTTRAAAAAAEIPESTIWRWLREPDFADALSKAKTALLDSVLTSLAATSGKAIEALCSVLDDKEAQASTKVSAARAVLEYGLKVREAVETENRLKLLEARFEAAERKE